MLSVKLVSPTRVVDIIADSLDQAKEEFMMRFGYWPNAYSVLSIERID